jgi:thiol-disulfide isomerase/thioredoxin
MKKLAFLLCCLFTFLVTHAQYNNLKIHPQNPEPGALITIEYSPYGTVLGDAQIIKAIVYTQDTTVYPVLLELKKVGNIWKAELQSNKLTKGYLLGFKSDEVVDNNKGDGYYILFTQNEVPVKGSNIAQAELKSWGGYRMQMNPNPEKELALYKKDFETYPELKTKYLFSYIGVLKSNNDTSALKEILREKLSIENKKEEDYSTAIRICNMLRKKEQEQQLTAEAKQKFPSGETVQSEFINDFWNQNTLAQKEIWLKKFLALFPGMKELPSGGYDFIYTSIMEQAAKEKNWASVQKYAANVKSNMQLATSYNQIAWNQSGESIEGKAGDLMNARKFSAKALSNSKTELQTFSSRPPFMSKDEYSENLNYSIANFYDTYALILWKLKLADSAYYFQKIAAEEMKFDNAEVNERFFIYTKKVKGSAAAQTLAELFIRKGKATPVIKKQLKEIFLSQKKTATEFETYLESFAAEAREKMRKELVKKMIQEPAYSFSLKDLNNNAVSLASLKGKIVIVDFWAIWCGPCRASFPAMQAAQEKFKKDSNVVFLFIDTWESKSIAEMQKDAADFISKNKYNFQVLLDTDDKVIQSYGVQGIPTKFIIDEKGDIRFKSVGYSGSVEALVDEMSIMIELAKRK